MAALQSELNFALEAVNKVPAIGVVREQERVLAPSADIDPRAPENQSALLWQHNFLIPTPTSKRSKHFLASHTNNFSSLV